MNASAQPVEADRTVTIAVCTWNRAALLEPLLAELVRQCLQEPRASVLVVDNNSTDGTAGVVGRHPGAVYVFEPRQGLSHARNRALYETTSAWVAYLDDECRVPPGWVSGLVRILEASGADVVGGPYDGLVVGKAPSWLTQEMISHDRPGGPRLLEDQEFVSGGNFAVRRDVALGVGGFDPGLGMAGRRTAFGEEVALQAAIRMKRGTVSWRPELRVAHVVRAQKLRATRHLLEAHGRQLAWNREFPSSRGLLRLVSAWLFAMARLLSALVVSVVRSQSSASLAARLMEAALPLVREMGAVAGDVIARRDRRG